MPEQAVTYEEVSDRFLAVLVNHASDPDDAAPSALFSQVEQPGWYSVTHICSLLAWDTPRESFVLDGKNFVSAPADEWRKSIPKNQQPTGGAFKAWISQILADLEDAELIRRKLVTTRAGIKGVALIQPTAKGRERVAEKPQSGKGTESPNPIGSKRRRKALWVAEAMLLKQEHPDWPDVKIASEVGVDPAQLSRCQAYQQAKAIERGEKSDHRSGHVTTDPDTGQRDVEAYSDWDDPA